MHQRRGQLGWQPEVSFQDLVTMMVEHDLELENRNFPDPDGDSNMTIMLGTLVL